jgi:hypothetical protein
MRASSQRREAADDPLMALVNVVREPRGDDQGPRTGRRLLRGAVCGFELRESRPRGKGRVFLATLMSYEEHQSPPRS